MRLLAIAAAAALLFTPAAAQDRPELAAADEVPMGLAPADRAQLSAMRTWLARERAELIVDQARLDAACRFDEAEPCASRGAAFARRAQAYDRAFVWYRAETRRARAGRPGEARVEPL